MHPLVFVNAPPCVCKCTSSSVVLEIWCYLIICNIVVVADRRVSIGIFPCGFRLEDFGEKPGFFPVKKNLWWSVNRIL